MVCSTPSCSELRTPLSDAPGGGRIRRIHFDQIDSTNEEARRRVMLHQNEPVLITAERQTQGRGRNGRTWQSPRGGAWLSLLWPLSKPAECYQSIPLVAGLAVLRLLQQLIQTYKVVHIPQIHIKWPNDVLLDDRKVAGILCETVVTGSRVSHLIIGVGVNVGFHSNILLQPLRHPPVTLKEAFRINIPVDRVVDGFVNQFLILMHRYEKDGLSPGMLKELRAHLAYWGQIRRWSFAEQTIEAQIRGLDDDGRLILDIDGQERTVDYGEILASDVETIDG